MIDAGTALRRSYITRLTGNVTYAGHAVKVVDGKVEPLPAGQEEWIVLSDQTDEDKSNKSRFVNESVIEIQVYSRKRSVSGKKVVEEIASQIMNLVLPTGVVHGLNIASPFWVTWVKYITGVAATVKADAANNFENIKTLQFRNRVTQ